MSLKNRLRDNSKWERISDHLTQGLAHSRDSDLGQGEPKFRQVQRPPICIWLGTRNLADSSTDTKPAGSCSSQEADAAGMK